MQILSKVAPEDVFRIILRRPWATPLQALLKGRVLEPPPPPIKSRVCTTRKQNKFPGSFEILIDELWFFLLFFFVSFLFFFLSYMLLTLSLTFLML